MKRTSTTTTLDLNLKSERSWLASLRLVSTSSWFLFLKIESGFSRFQFFEDLSMDEDLRDFQIQFLMVLRFSNQKRRNR